MSGGSSTGADAARVTSNGGISSVAIDCKPVIDLPAGVLAFLSQIEFCRRKTAEVALIPIHFLLTVFDDAVIDKTTRPQEYLRMEANQIVKAKTLFDMVDHTFAFASRGSTIDYALFTFVHTCIPVYL